MRARPGDAATSGRSVRETKTKPLPIAFAQATAYSFLTAASASNRCNWIRAEPSRADPIRVTLCVSVSYRERSYLRTTRPSARDQPVHFRSDRRARSFSGVFGSGRSLAASPRLREQTAQKLDNNDYDYSNRFQLQLAANCIRLPEPNQINENQTNLILQCVLIIMPCCAVRVTIIFLLHRLTYSIVIIQTPSE